MFSRAGFVTRAFIAVAALVLPACSMSGSSAPVMVSPSANVLHALSGRGGGGPAQIPPPSTIDGPAWFVYDFSAATNISPNVDFGALKNSVQGAMAIGSTRTATEIVYNISKKTALRMSAITMTGPNAGDFTIPAAAVQAVLKTPIPAKHGSAAVLPITFSPSAEGVRTGTLRLVSNAGTMLIALTGAGLPARPIIVTSSSFSFLPASAPANFTVSNGGGQTLTLKSIAFGGANPGSFQLTVANGGLSNCFAGVPLAPHSLCHLAIGLTPGAPVPSSAFLAITSNDPVHPKFDIALQLTP